MNWEQSYKWKPFTLLVSAEEVEKNMSKFNVGDRVRIIAEKHGHGHNIGEVVTIESIDYDKTEIYTGEWYLRFEEIEPINYGPIRTVTSREIVAGNYGRIHLSRDFSMGNRNLRLALCDSAGDTDPSGHYWNLEELDEVIHTLTQVREVIAEENTK